MTTQEMFEIIIQDFRAFREENNEAHGCIMDKIEMIRQDNSTQDLAIRGVEIDARNTSKDLNEHKRKHWTLFVALLIVFLTAAISIWIQLGAK